MKYWMVKSIREIQTSKTSNNSKSNKIKKSNTGIASQLTMRAIILWRIKLTKRDKPEIVQLVKDQKKSMNYFLLYR